MITTGLLAAGVIVGAGVASSGPARAAPASGLTQAGAALDTNNRAAVATSYRDVLKPALAVPGAYTGDAARCRAGSETPASRTATLTAVNWFRAMGGLGRVSFDAALDARAQQTAMLMKANGRLDHHPPSSWRCFNTTADRGAGESNLALGVSGAKAMLAYMDDVGLDSVGHRRWLMHAPITRMGHGATDSSDALLALGAPTSTAQPNPRWVAWPSAGYVPVQVEPRGWWSLSANSKWGTTDFSRARVTVQRDGRNVPVDVRPVRNNFGADTLVFSVATGTPDRRSIRNYPDTVFDVSVTNIVTSSGTVSHRYRVILFDAERAGTSGSGGGGGTVRVEVDPGGRTPSAAPGLTSIVPARLFDTRPGTRTVDGAGAGTGLLQANTTVELPVAGRGGVASNAAAVMVNLTAINPLGRGYVVAWPCGEAAPTASSLNFAPGPARANNVVVKIGRDGMICLRTSAPVDLAVDATGFGVGNTGLRAVVPARLLDTRAGRPTVDGVGSGVGRVGAGSTTRVRVAGRGGVPNDAAAVWLNLTSVGASDRGFVLAWPCGADRPTASNLNFRRNEVIAVGALARVGADGAVCLYNSAASDLVVDVTGYVGRGAAVDPVVPARLFDTRSGAATVDGGGAGGGPLRAGTTRTIQVAGRGGVGGGADAAVLQVTAVNAPDRGFVSVWPCGAQRPTASVLNLRSSAAIANSTLADLDGNGRVCLFANVDTDVVVDVVAAVE